MTWRARKGQHSQEGSHEATLLDLSHFLRLSGLSLIGLEVFPLLVRRDLTPLSRLGKLAEPRNQGLARRLLLATHGRRSRD
jgi:hypothetical protein